jgi:ABC-type Mn2+/Zn2+ transport system permease subunit
VDSNLNIIIIAIMIGASSGAIGSFVLLRRMALVGDALSHVALPGIALALAYSLDPFWGVVGFLVPAAVLVWWLETKTPLHPEALVGLLFTTSLAVGILTIPEIEILESLFGGFPALSWNALIGISIAAAVLIVSTFLGAQRFALVTVAPELCAPKMQRKSDLLLLVVFAMIVSLGIKLVGTLLMGALTVIPAGIARNSTFSFKQYMVASTFAGAVIAATGAMMAHRFAWVPGPTIVILGSALFVLSLAFSKTIRPSARSAAKS